MHRDIKPANILLERRGRELRALLADFGLARLAEFSAGLTTTGSWLGTVDYAAPETLAGDPATPAADIYALGAVLHAALTGRPPFARETAAAVIWATPTSRRRGSPRSSTRRRGAREVSPARWRRRPRSGAGAGELADAVRAAAGPPRELPLLAQPLALIGELASEITTDPMGAADGDRARAARRGDEARGRPGACPRGRPTRATSVARRSRPRDAARRRRGSPQRGRERPATRPRLAATRPTTAPAARAERAGAPPVARRRPPSSRRPTQRRPVEARPRRASRAG